VSNSTKPEALKVDALVVSINPSWVLFVIDQFDDPNKI
jgi:hypothetical protein